MMSEFLGCFSKILAYRAGESANEGRQSDGGGSEGGFFSKRS